MRVGPYSAGLLSRSAGRRNGRLAEALEERHERFAGAGGQRPVVLEPRVCAARFTRDPAPISEGELESLGEQAVQPTTETGAGIVDLLLKSLFISQGTLPLSGVADSNKGNHTPTFG
ncbi:MAG: hypothetical protein JWL75_26 [Parcubacteria group bacterium]|nr:hypothetical protein [Parcubacteria group bacterium]